MTEGTVRAKFKCNSILKAESFDASAPFVYAINLSAVYSSDPNSENGKFWKYSPVGKIELGTINESAAKAFEVGKEFYIDFIPAG